MGCVVRAAVAAVLGAVLDDDDEDEGALPLRDLGWRTEGVRDASVERSSTLVGSPAAVRDAERGALLPDGHT